MDIKTVWNDSKYPSFNLELSNNGKDPFLVVKGCRIVSGGKGEFVAPPSTKGNNDKYWNHAYFSADFGKVILEKAKESQPKTQQTQAKAQSNSFADFDENIPF
jgi:DNA-binding cell septation regulator SpoVG